MNTQERINELIEQLALLPHPEGDTTKKRIEVLKPSMVNKP